MKDLTCLSYWFPKLKAAGLPVPRTTIIEMPAKAFRDVFRVFDGESMKGDAQPFFDAIKNAANAFGYPCFLRTGLTSAKHFWEKTCFLPSAEAIPAHVIEIVEFSECAQLMGLDCGVWAVREMLPTLPIAILTGYGNMPACREFRFFVDGPEIECWHPYWPEQALEEGGAGESYASLSEIDDPGPLLKLAGAAGLAVGGRWSVDILETKRGWFITDMAESDKSFHWEQCATHSVNK